ncbi:OmpH family outer membrane protein [Segetibacter sp.]|jgi:outer membrane protein|uniref:OmpH family outer membrane protein n=1 Tax=Segetibacter sp. TaxID=2231182 RepID=UPI002626976C|nr:OmpH family outer membrane protein [Segetibacter sp.]MCW3079169.1 OmpH family outer membrane protein [Segetibacter sp.]
MKKFLFIAIAVVLASASVSAQRYAIIDTKFILDKMPEYKDADKRLALVSEQWQKEIDAKQGQLNQMYRNYEAEQYMLTEDLKKKREDQLFNSEKEIRDLQKKRFGYEGDLFKERQKLVKPVQDKVYNAIQKMAVNRGYDFVLDKSEGITVIFADPKLDKSDEVLRELGLKS